MSDLANNGLLALIVLAAGAFLRWIQQRPIKAARKRAEAAAGEAQTAQLGTVAAQQQAQEAEANATLAQQEAAIGGMDAAALDADAAARVERARRERAAAGVPERHRD